MAQRERVADSDERPFRRVGDQRTSSGDVLSLERLHVVRAPRSPIPRSVVRAVVRHSVLALTDTLALAATAWLFAAARQLPLPSHTPVRLMETVLIGIVAPTPYVVSGMLLGLFVMGAYHASDSRRDPVRIARGVLVGLALPFWHVAWTSPSAWAVPACVIFALSVAFLAICGRLLVDALVRRVSPIGTGAPRALLVCSVRDRDAAMTHPALTDRREFSLVGHFDVENVSVGPDVRAVLDRLLATIRFQRIDTVVFAGPLEGRLLGRLVDVAAVSGCQLYAVGTERWALTTAPQIVWRRGAPLLELNRPALRARDLLVKRVLDVAGASVLLVLLAPVMLVVACGVRLSGPGPIFFGQERVGLRGRLFRCFKFRSMRADAERMLQDDPTLFELYRAHDFKLPDALDPRLTPFGRFIRRTSLDELPQLWNVLRGDMSLVGPRPIVPKELAHYEDSVALFTSIKPGLTGAWAVQGRSTLAYPDRADVELDYIRSWSVWRDIGLLLRTIGVVATGRGAH